MIVDRLRVDDPYEGIVLDLSERLMIDPLLSKFFGSYSLEKLCVLHREVLDWVLAQEVNEEEEKIQILRRKKLLIRHTPLILAGFNRTHFDRVKAHLIDVLIKFWLDTEVIEHQVTTSYEALKNGFFGRGNWLKIVHPTNKYTNSNGRVFPWNTAKDDLETYSSEMKKLIAQRRPGWAGGSFKSNKRARTMTPLPALSY
jgi:hypothetical protein